MLPRHLRTSRPSVDGQEQVKCLPGCKILGVPKTVTEDHWQNTCRNGSPTVKEVCLRPAAPSIHVTSKKKLPHPFIVNLNHKNSNGVHWTIDLLFTFCHFFHLPFLALPCGFFVSLGATAADPPATPASPCPLHCPLFCLPPKIISAFAYDGEWCIYLMFGLRSFFYYFLHHNRNQSQNA